MGSSLLFVLPAFVLGLVFGSFLNVCISRVPRGESVTSPGSHCEVCGRHIRWYDNLPLVSWVLLRGRCRDCGQTISWRYPAVELAVGIWFGVGALRLHDALAVGYASAPSLTMESWAAILTRLAFFVVAGFLLIGLCVMDWQTHRLPDAFTYSGIAAGLFLICTQAIFLGPAEDQIHLHRRSPINSAGAGPDHGDVFLTGPETLLGGRLVAILGAAAVLLLVRWLYRVVRRREGMGLGDVKLIAMIAALCGFWPSMLALLIGVVLGSLHGAVLLARRKASALTRLPLGTFLCIGGLIVVLWGEQALAWYRGLL
jgi:leader peptidase (prepilin peptidase)/N-methyltransferase